MIYIDPPYNTGSDGFVYQDDRKFTVKELQNLAGLDEEQAKRILNFTQSKSNSHSAWLTFMYPRLYIARQLLKDDGVIFVSIDDNEFAQLRLIMDDVFGEGNSLTKAPTALIWQQAGTTAGHFAKSHEYILCYAKNKEALPYFSLLNYGDNSIIAHGALKKISKANPASEIIFPKGKIEFEGEDTTFEGEIGGSEKQIISGKLIFRNGLLAEDARITAGWAMRDQVISWLEGNETYDTKGQKIMRFYFNSSGILWYEKERGTIHPKTVLDKEIVSTKTGAGEIKDLLGGDFFENPKPLSLINYLLSFVLKSDDLILDFFAGSGTTGDAVMQLNAADGGNRKYILVQLPEPIDPKKNKAAYDFVKDVLGVAEPTIFEITKERLIRAAKKIKAETIVTKIAEKEKELKAVAGQLELENKIAKTAQLQAEIEALKTQDLGFKIFETTPIWDDYNFEADELNNQTQLFDNTRLTEEDVKNLLTTWKTYDGIPLTQPLQTIDLGGYTGHYGNGKLYLMQKSFTTDNLKALLEKTDADATFEPKIIIAFGYHFESKNLREIAENIKTYANKKHTDIDFITRY